jgi:AraC-like DNA-binding protein
LALFSTIDDSSLNTLRILIVAVIANWLVSALRIVNCVTPGDDNSWTVFFAGSQTLIIAYVIFAVFKQEAGFKQHVQVAREALQESIIGDESGEKYANSSLSAAHRERIQQKLDHAMRIEKRYTDNEISLSALCDFIQESPHQVSQVINESDYQNFYDLINQHRVDAAKEQLLSRPEQSVLEVAFAVGFNSKSTFNSAFKRYVNVTPTQYRLKLTAYLATE